MEPLSWKDTAAAIARDAGSRATPGGWWTRRRCEEEAEAGLCRLDSVEAGGDHPLRPALTVVRAAAEAAGKYRLDLECRALELIAADPEATCGGFAALASLAAGLAKSVPVPEWRPASAPTPERVADAAFAALPETSWKTVLTTLPHTTGLLRLEVAARTVTSDRFETRCASAVEAMRHASGGEWLTVARAALQADPTSPVQAYVLSLLELARVDPSAWYAPVDASLRAAAAGARPAEVAARAAAKADAWCRPLIVPPEDVASVATATLRATAYLGGVSLAADTLRHGLERVVEMVDSRGPDDTRRLLGALRDVVRAVAPEQRAHVLEQVLTLLAQDAPWQTGTVARLVMEALPAVPDPDLPAFSAAALDAVSVAAERSGDRVYAPSMIDEARRADRSGLGELLQGLSRLGDSFIERVARDHARPGGVEATADEVVIGGVVRLPVNRTHA